MSSKERDRLDVMNRIKRKELTVKAGVRLLKLSLRQMRRLSKRFKAKGAAGLVHGLRGQTGNRGIRAATADRIVQLHQSKYRDFGPTLACEKLAQEDEALCISPDTLVRLLKAHELYEPMRHRRRHRRRRPRRSCFGELLQMDGSHHDWFEGRSAVCCLMNLVDDATGMGYARFYPAETTAAAMDIFSRWIGKHGVPRSLYVDRHGIYRDEDHPEKPTQFGRAMRQLDVELILARSPQAKGRIERRHAVFQDRLVKEMRLRKISSIEQANSLLDSAFLDELNRRYRIAARDKTNLHRRPHPQMALPEILCISERRTVGNDWCVRWHNRFMQIGREHAGLMLAGKAIDVKEKLDGTLLLCHGALKLQYQPLDQNKIDEKPPEQKTGKRTIINNKPWKPQPNHPWQQPAVDLRK